MARNRSGIRSRRRRAVSLLEVAASVMVAGICIGATASAIHVITCNGANLAQRGEAQTAAAIAIHRIRSELSMAITVTELTSQSAAITHPDVTGDGIDDVIRYAWSGTTGDPITREFNSGAAAAVLDDCNGFTLAVDIEDPVEDLEPETTGEVQVAAHDQYPGGYVYSTIAMEVKSPNRVAEYFTPSYAGAVSCDVTRVLISMRRAGSGGGTATISIQPRAAGTYNPSGTFLGEATVAGTDLPAEFQWREFAFSDVTVPVDTGLTVVVQGDSSNSGQVETHLLSFQNFIDGVTLRYTTNNGGSWLPNVNLARWDMRIYVYGSYTLSTTTGSGVFASGWLESIHMQVRTPTGAQDAVFDSAIHCLNRPSVAGLSVGDIPVR